MGMQRRAFCRYLRKRQTGSGAKLVFFVKDNVHPIIDLFNSSSLMVAHFLVQMKISCFLQYGIQTPMIGAIDLFCRQDSGLSISFVSMFLHDPDRRYPFSAAIFLVDYPNSANIFIPGNNEIINSPRLFIPCHDLLETLCCRAHIIVLILYQQL